MKHTVLIVDYAPKQACDTDINRKMACLISSKLKDEHIGASYFPIVPVEEYPCGTGELESVSVVEKETLARPELEAEYSHMDDVRIMVLVVPNWWNAVPMPVMTFLESYDFTGKKILPVIAHGGDGADKVMEYLREHFPSLDFLAPVAYNRESMESAASEAVAALRF